MPIDYGTHNISTSGNIVASSGNFSALTVNGNPIGEGGAVVDNFGDNRLLTSTGTVGGINAESNLTFDGTNLNLNNQTASTIASFDSSKNLVSLSTTTYPNFTELSYVKGVTSSIQTQIDGKSSTSHTHGNITSAGAIGSTANLPLITTTSGVITTGSFGSTANTFCQGNDSRLNDSRAPTGSAGGDLTGTYPNPTLTTTGVTGGTYRSVTVDTKGRITGGTNPTTIAGYGITDALQLSGGTLTGPVEISTGAINNNYNEGLRLTAANNGWTGITFGSTGLSGAPTNGWFAARNPSNQFIISPADSSSTTGITLNSGGNALWRNNIILHAGNYNSYAPTLTGGSASGTWSINVTGTAASETLATVTGRGASTGSNITTTGAMYASNWYRSYGTTGWYNETYGGGIWMSDSTWVRVYNNKQFFADNIIQSASSVRAPIFYDSNDTAFYCDPNATSRFAGLVITGTDLYVGDGVTSSIIRMRDSDEGERAIHCNSNRIGFLNQSGGWGSWCNDDGSWSCYGGTVRALEAIGGWNQYGAVAEFRTDGVGTQDGPRLFYHKASAKWWAAGIQGGGSNGYAIWEDGSSSQWGTERLRIDPGGRVNMPIGWDTSGRNYSREWIEFNNHTGLYSPLNGAHFYPNNASYGPWRIAGTRNGWNGLEFDSTGAGQISLMMNSGHTGVHNNTHGWQWYWTGGAFYVSKGSNGGGTIATVLDTSNYAANAPVSVRTFRAWGTYDSTTGVSPAVLDGINVTTAARTANGTCRVDFSGITLPNTNYGVLAISGVGSTVASSRTTTSVVILTQTTAAVLTNTIFTVGIIDTI